MIRDGPQSTQRPAWECKGSFDKTARDNRNYLPGGINGLLGRELSSKPEGTIGGMGLYSNLVRWTVSADAARKQAARSKFLRSVRVVRYYGLPDNTRQHTRLEKGGAD